VGKCPHVVVNNKRYACGATDSEGGDDYPCPASSAFPKLDDYELQTKLNEQYKEWCCTARPKTDMARRVLLGKMSGKTEEEAKQRLINHYNSIANH
jgi:hypothetical protein